MALTQKLPEPIPPIPRSLISWHNNTPIK